jgi:hypothetical protein
MSTRVIRLRYAGTCAGWGQALAAGTRAWWDADARSTTCEACRDQASAAPSGGNVEVESVGVEAVPEAEVPRVAGLAGGSARQKFERLHQARQERIDRRWGRLSGIVKFLSDDPQRRGWKSLGRYSRGTADKEDGMARDHFDDWEPRTQRFTTSGY